MLHNVLPQNILYETCMLRLLRRPIESHTTFTKPSSTGGVIHYALFLRDSPSSGRVLSVAASSHVRVWQGGGGRGGIQGVVSGREGPTSTMTSSVAFVDAVSTSPTTAAVVLFIAVLHLNQVQLVYWRFS